MGTAKLSSRELEIISWIAEGLPSKLIADRLSITTNTVQAHRRNILRKMGAKNSIGAVTMYLRKEMI
jgi:DNA-binding CsgD family transcriptional regulator